MTNKAKICIVCNTKGSLTCRCHSMNYCKRHYDHHAKAMLKRFPSVWLTDELTRRLVEQ